MFGQDKAQPLLALRKGLTRRWVKLGVLAVFCHGEIETTPIKGTQT
jgi:hypothetical protein